MLDPSFYQLSIRKDGPLESCSEVDICHWTKSLLVKKVAFA